MAELNKEWEERVISYEIWSKMMIALKDTHSQSFEIKKPVLFEAAPKVITSS